MVKETPGYAGRFTLLDLGRNGCNKSDLNHHKEFLLGR